MGESRTELLQWLNELLQINYVKVEQCGTGGAYCQILDSVYGDVPMSKVKMNAKHEYEYLANFKVLQNAFKAKKIEKPIEIEKLVKCKMQDNLDFLQWMKRFWDQNYASDSYDPVARRKGVPVVVSATVAPVARAVSTHHSGGGGGLRPGGGARAPSARTGSSAGGYTHEFVHNLQTQVRELVAQVEGVEKERDFYFAKLRDIEILVQARLEGLEQAGEDDETLRDVQKILYSTEEGFEAPDVEGEGDLSVQAAGLQLHDDEEETF